MTQDQDVRVCLSSYPTFRHELTRNTRPTVSASASQWHCVRSTNTCRSHTTASPMGQLEADDTMGLLATSGVD